MKPAQMMTLTTLAFSGVAITENRKIGLLLYGLNAKKDLIKIAAVSMSLDQARHLVGLLTDALFDAKWEAA